MRLTPEAETLLIRMALVSYGAVASYQTRTRGGEATAKPLGEAKPMHDRWSQAFEAAGTEDELRDLIDAARAELDAWIRRPFAPEAVETLEDLCGRVVSDGWGVPAEECARAMRCTPTLVRRARLAAHRHPETGYSLPAPARHAMTWAHKLDAAGLTLRQIETLTGVPKSTLHERLGRPRRAA